MPQSAWPGCAAAVVRQRAWPARRSRRPARVPSGRRARLVRTHDGTAIAEACSCPSSNSTRRPISSARTAVIVAMSAPSSTSALSRSWIATSWRRVAFCACRVAVTRAADRARPQGSPCAGARLRRPLRRVPTVSIRPTSSWAEPVAEARTSPCNRPRSAEPRWPARAISSPTRGARSQLATCARGSARARSSRAPRAGGIRRAAGPEAASGRAGPASRASRSRQAIDRAHRGRAARSRNSSNT